MSDASIAPQFSTPTEPPHNHRTTWVVIGVAGGLGLLAIIAVSVMIGFPLVKSLLSGGGASGNASYSIEEISTEPHEVWQYRYAPAAEEYIDGRPTIAAVGSHAMLTIGSFDYWSWQDENVDGAWYPGFPAHYALGYAAGLEYQQAAQDYEADLAAWEAAHETAYATWQADYDKRWDAYFDGAGSYPDWDWDDSMVPGEYPTWPSMYDFLEDDWYDPGYTVGFDDAAEGRPEGENIPATPPDPKWRAGATLVDLKTGEELWTLSLADTVEDFDYSQSARPMWIAGTDVIVIDVPVSSEDSDVRHELLAISTSNGEVLSSKSTEGPVLTAQSNGDLIILELAFNPETFEDEPGTLLAVNPAKLDGEPKWTKNEVLAQSVSAADGYVFAFSSSGEGSLILDAATGETAAWGRDLGFDSSGDSGVFYQAVGNGNFLRMEVSGVSFGSNSARGGVGLYAMAEGSGGYIELSGVNANAERTWERAQEVGMVYADFGVMFVGEVSSRTGLVEDLMRIDLKTGEPMWESPNYDAYAGILMIAGDVALALDEDEERLLALDLDSGEVRYSQRLPSDAYWDGQWASDNLYYLASDEGRLQAYSVEEPGAVWSMRYDSEVKRVVQVGARLAILDVDRRTIALLDEQ